jgi:hypothetical protein
MKSAFTPRRGCCQPHTKKVNRTESDLTEWASLRRHLEELLQLTLSGTEESLLTKVADIIPEYIHQRGRRERDLLESLQLTPFTGAPPLVPAEAGD